MTGAPKTRVVGDHPRPRADLGAFFSPLLALLLSGCGYYQPVPPDPLTEVEIIRMTKEGVPAAEIIEAIRDSRTIYIMDAEDVIRLHEEGVDERVIDFMLQTHRRDLERRAYHERYWYDPWYGPYPFWPYPRLHVHYGCWW